MNESFNNHQSKDENYYSMDEEQKEDFGDSKFQMDDDGEYDFTKLRS